MAISDISQTVTMSDSSGPLRKVKSCYNPLRLGTVIVLVSSGIEAGEQMSEEMTNDDELLDLGKKSLPKMSSTSTKKPILHLPDQETRTITVPSLSGL